MKGDRAEGITAAAAACFDDDFSCRICLEPSTRSEVIAPCSCRGSSKWVHRECLDKWRTTREDKAFSKCTECLLTYTLIARVDDSYQPKLMRRAKFFFLVLRDFTIAFLLLQLLIVGLSTLVYASDFFPSATHSKLFYYCAGLIIFLSVLGMLYFLGYSTSRMNQSGDCFRCCQFCCRSCSMAGPLNDGSCPCMMCMDCGGGTGVHHCCQLGLMETNFCACFTDLFASASAEFAPVLLIIIAIAAFVGAIAAVFAGSLFMQRVISSHVHVLQKKGLANDFIVADLDVSHDIRSSENIENSDSPPENIHYMNRFENRYEGFREESRSSSQIQRTQEASGIISNYSNQDSAYNCEESSGIHVDQNSDISTTLRNSPRVRTYSSLENGLSNYSNNDAESVVDQYQHTASTPALSAAQRRELTSLGLL